MALINCSECGKEISDKAITCPNCGYPINVESDKLLNELKKQAIENKKEKEKTKFTVFLWCAIICSIVCVILTFWLSNNGVNFASAHLSEFSAEFGHGFISSEEKSLLQSEKIVTAIRNILIVPSVIFIIVSIYLKKSSKYSE